MKYPDIGMPIHAAGATVSNDSPQTHTAGQPITRRSFTCICGRPIFFRNSVCLACGTPLGYWPERDALLPLVAADQAGGWREAGKEASSRIFHRCDCLGTSSACNWLVGDFDASAGNKAHCVSCRLTRRTPDLSVEENAHLWGRAEVVKRRLVSSLIGLGLPVTSKRQDPAHGLAFDFLRSQPNATPVVTGHENGVITLDLEEADSSVLEARRKALHEPYRTLLGHMRHECGHYYWQELISDGDASLTAFRARFGDERVDYGDALSRHYAKGAPANWGQTYVSAYASSHPWEDWAETWAHFMHLQDTVDTAKSFGIDTGHFNVDYEPFAIADSSCANEPGFAGFLEVVNEWVRMTGALNELARSMGMLDFYPFALSLAVVEKLYFVDRLIKSRARGTPKT